MQVREKTFPASLRALWERAVALPWLSLPGITIIVLLVCLPFALVEVPPLIDVPGHMGAAAIEAARPGQSSGQVPLVEVGLHAQHRRRRARKADRRAVRQSAAGWWSTVLATGLFAGGCLATIRVLNPKGGHGAPWALMFVFSFPLLTGFLNYILATGLSLMAFAAAVWLEDKPKQRAALLIVAQPVAMLCHAIGGLLLGLLVGANALGREIDRLPAGWWRPSEWRRLRDEQDWRAIAKRLFILCWPLVATVVTILLWKYLSPDPARSMNRWRSGSEGLVFRADLARSVAARWRDDDRLLRADPVRLAARRAVEVAARSAGSARVPAVHRNPERHQRQQLRRCAPPAGRLHAGAWPSGLEQGDARTRADGRACRLRSCWARGWSSPPPSFADYADDYRKQLSALHHVEPGSRVLAFVEHSCIEDRGATPGATICQPRQPLPAGVGERPGRCRACTW
jgi:uncharacterized membrane protein